MSGLSCRLQLPLAQFELAVELSVPPGVTVLLGPNGAGKSSLLRLLTGLTRPRAGRIALNGRLLYHGQTKLSLPPEQRQIGMVFQELALFPHLDVSENIAFGLRARGGSRSKRQQVVGQLLERLGLAQLAQRRIDKLSGGERQKVALARTLAIEPQLLLLDEPTAALDRAARNGIRSWLQQLLTELPIPTLLVTHDAEEVAYFRKRVAVMEQGRIVQRGSYHQLLREPASEFVAQFAGVNILRGELLEAAGRRRFVSQNGAELLGVFNGSLPGPATLAIAPWDIALFPQVPKGSPQNILQGTVAELVVLGDRVRVCLAGKEKLVAEISLRAWERMGRFDRGEPLFAVFKAREARVVNC